MMKVFSLPVVFALLTFLSSERVVAQQSGGPTRSVDTVRGKDSVEGIDANRNAEGHLTLALVDRAKEVGVFQRTNDGKWEIKGTAKLDSVDPPRIVLADLGKDGLDEILVCSDKLRVYSQTPDGITLSWTSKESFPSAPYPRVSVADFNDDGLTDIAVLNYKKKDKEEGTHSLYLYTRTLLPGVDYALADRTTFTDEHGFHSTSAISISDFTGDGHPEIVVGNDNGFLWLLAFRNGKLEVRENWKVQSGGAIGPGLAAGDLDKDSVSELLVGTNGGSIFVYRFSDRGTPTVVASAEAGRLAYGVAAGDIDGDGKDEFILSRGELHYAGMTEDDVVVEVWKLVDDRLKRVWQRQTVDATRPLVLDVNGDGRDDVVVYSLRTGTFKVLEPAE